MTPIMLRRRLALGFLLASFSSVPLLATNWRLADGTLTSAPAAAEVTAYSTLVSRDPDGAPAFAVPFVVSAGDVIAVSLTAEAVSAAADAGAEGQAGAAPAREGTT